MNVNHRIITVKGRKYRQTVSYKWDKEAKRGRTIIIKHDGPVSPVYREERKALTESKTKMELADYNTLAFRLDDVEVWKGKVAGNNKNSSKLKLPPDWKDKLVWVVLPRNQ